MKVGDTTINITECLNNYRRGTEDSDILNEFTHHGPEGLVRALSKVSGFSEGEIKSALQSMSIKEAADFAVGLGELTGNNPSIFEKSLGALTGATEEMIAKQLQVMLGNDYRKAVPIWA